MKFQNKVLGFVWGKIRRLGVGIMRKDWPLFRAKQFLGGKGLKFPGKGVKRVYKSATALGKPSESVTLSGLNAPGTPNGSVHTHFRPISTFCPTFHPRSRFPLLGFSQVKRASWSISIGAISKTSNVFKIGN